MDFETRAIHVGQEPDSATGAVTTPIYQTSTYAQEAVGVPKGYDSAPVGNPTRTALEECLASLENADFGLAFSSGLGAATTILHLGDPGQRLPVRHRAGRSNHDHPPRHPGPAARLRQRRVRRHVPHVLPGLRAEGVRLRLHHA